MCKICRECVGHLREVFRAMLESGGFVLSNEGLLDLNGGMDVKNLHKKIVEVRFLSDSYLLLVTIKIVAMIYHNVLQVSILYFGEFQQRKQTLTAAEVSDQANLSS